MAVGKLIQGIEGVIGANLGLGEWFKPYRRLSTIGQDHCFTPADLLDNPLGVLTQIDHTDCFHHHVPSRRRIVNFNINLMSPPSAGQVKSERTKRGWIATGLIGLCLLVGYGFYLTQSRRIAVVRRPRAVMGTSCMLVGVTSRYRQTEAVAALTEAEAVLRNLEARLSSWIDASEISQLNAAAAGQTIQLSTTTLAVLRAARRAYVETDGAFDVTCRPLIELWRKAGKLDRLPTAEEIATARSASQWEAIELIETGAVKCRGSARVDLGGIAKGYAIDAAVAALRTAGFEGGLVDVGGDERLFGCGVHGESWPVAVQNPFGSGTLCKMRLAATAVCTSGNYARYVQIDGHRYGHIIDPRTGQPAETAASVTVVARSALLADIWATALSVLGPRGIDRLPAGVDALIVTGGPDDYQMITSPGFRRRLGSDLPDRTELQNRVGR
jgi:thiamine biosynthesis lipoprotein